MKNTNLGKLAMSCKTGNERFYADNKDLGFDLTGFWQWNVSDLVSATSHAESWPNI